MLFKQLSSSRSPKEGREERNFPEVGNFFLNASGMGECSCHSEANVIVVYILRQRYSHSPCSQSELRSQGKINAGSVV